jgi:long-chain fatty acid transport protein
MCIKPIYYLSILLAISTFLAPAGSAFAGAPAFTRLFGAAEDAETALSTPAGMTRLEGTHLAAQGILVHSFAEFEIDENLTTMSGGNPDDSDPAVIPGVYYVRPLGEDWRLGLSMNVPSGFGASNGSDWAGRYYSDNFSLVFIGANATVAYPVNDWLSLGAGAKLIYSASESVVRVPNPGPEDKDAKLEVEASGAAVGWMVSALIEFSEQTRVGLNWHGEVEPDNDVELKLKRSTLPPDFVDYVNKVGDDIEVKLRTPQHIDIGLLHEWDNGWSASVDAIWVEFSRFGLTEIGIKDQDVDVPDGNFNDIWVFTAGLEFPLTERMKGRVGALYMEQPVDDEHRTLTFALDEVYGAGFGVVYRRSNGDLMDINLTLLNTGEAPIDTGEDTATSDRGRVVGEKDSPYAMTLEFSYHWK